MIQKSAILNFPKDLIDRPVISRVIREHDVEVNILQAHITPETDGHMFAIFSGKESAVDRALKYLKESQVRVALPTRNLVWVEDRCVDCTACVGQCPSAAFTVDEETREVSYDETRCIACKLCIPACSYGAVEALDEHFRRTGGL
ncbi:MAG: 4Fe-4S dicluster domain-containing protein [Deltaproteobacteria bacterium]|nr:4Fe-4S dicluster domain-containing protein [Deltaproteobacteria bacterium]